MFESYVLGQMYVISLLVFGLVVGSFLNVVVLRGIMGISIGGRSMCPGCARTLRWWELIPVLSFVLLRGRCRRCRAEISLQYPAIELATGFVAIVLGAPFPMTTSEQVVAVLLFIVVSLLIVLLVIDLKTMLLPDVYIGIMSVAVLIVTGIRSYESARYYLPLYWALAGIFVGAGVLGVIWLLTRGKGIGLGDVKLLIPLGALLGPFDSLMVLFLSFVAGGAVASFLLVTHKATMKTAIPFGPFLCVAAILVLLAPDLAGQARELLFGGYL